MEEWRAVEYETKSKVIRGIQFGNEGGFYLDPNLPRCEEKISLIAAAPELLEACKAMMRIKDLWLPDTCPPECEGEMEALQLAAGKFKVAIAKAGQES